MSAQDERWLRVSPPEGLGVYPSDWITIELLHPWYLRWLPTAKVRLRTDAAGHLYVEAAQRVAAVFDAAQAFTQDASDDNFAALQQAVGAHKPDGADEAAPPDEQQAEPAATAEAPPS